MKNIILVIKGFIMGIANIIPGVSGLLVLMLLGYYLPIINALTELINLEYIFPNIFIILFFGLGVLIGILLVARLIEWLLKKYEIKTYFGLIGFIVASVIAIPVSVYHEITTVIFRINQVLIGLVFLVIGTLLGYKLGEK